jgi:hypothetical protein
MKSPDDCSLLQFDTDSVQGWCTANFMKLDISKTRVITFPRKTNIILIYDYKLCQFSVVHTDSIKDLGVFIDSKLHFQNMLTTHFLSVLSCCGLFALLTFHSLLWTAYICYILP